MSRTGLITTTDNVKRGKRPRVGRTLPCRPKGKREIRFCRLMQQTMDHDRHVTWAIGVSTGAVNTVYDRGKKFPYMVWNVCPYCGESLVPLVARRAPGVKGEP